MKTDLFYKDERSDKEYHIQLRKSGPGQFDVLCQYGRRGGTLKPETKVVGVSYQEAAKVYNRVVKEKTGKGYRGEVQLAPDEEPEEAPAVESAFSGPALEKKVHSGIEPCELLTEIAEHEQAFLLDSDRYALQVKEDGNRRMIRRTDGVVEGINRKGELVMLPDVLVKEYLSMPADQFILDGEIIGDTMVLWDILELNGRDIRKTDYERRLLHLCEVVHNNGKSWRPISRPHVSVVETWFGKEKPAGLAQLRARRAEGGVFKDINAPFRPGRAGQHFKLKFQKSCTARVKSNHPSKASVVVELRDASGKWIEVGSVSVPEKNGRLSPGSLVEVRYLYATEARKLFQPCFLGVRNDLEETACVFGQLKYKQGVIEEAA